jgi:hypothetical protein
MNVLMMILLIGMPLAAQKPASSADDSTAAKPEAAKTDKTEKVRTPFGVTTRSTDAKPKPARKPGPDPRVRFEENGDTITFRRQTPFGDQVWTRKRSELTDAEKQILAAQSSAATMPAAPSPAASSK